MDQAYNIHSLGGQPCTPELTSVFAQACALPAPAMSSLWELLDRAIMDPIPDDLNERVGVDWWQQCYQTKRSVRYFGCFVCF